MRCILHIGTEKTGTTTIQDFLNINRVLLGESGFVFTKSLGLTNNRALPFLAYDGTREDDYTWHQHLHDRRKRDAAREHLLAEISKELSGIPDDTTVIFSSEHLQSRLLSPGDLARLSKILTGLGFESIKVLVYLRDPVEGAVSLLSTGIKGPATSVALPETPSHHVVTVFDHRATITRWSETFGSANIVPRLFSRECLHNGDLLEDFIDACQLPTRGYQIPEKRNESLNVVGMELLARINKKVPTLIDRMPNRLRSDIVSYFERHFTRGSRFVPDQATARKYEEYFAESNEWVRTRLFPERTQPLFPSRKFGNAAAPIDSETLDQVGNLISDIWLSKERRLITLSKSGTSHETMEFSEPTDLLTALFFGILGRNPDPSEKETCFKNLVQRGGIPSVLSDLIRSDEFATKFPELKRPRLNPAAAYNKETIVFLEIPGTGEETLQGMLESSFGSHEFFGLHSDSLYQFAPGELAEHSVFAGYFSHDSIAYIPRRSASVFTVVREPKSRLLSLYQLWRSKRAPNPSHHSEVQLSDDSSAESFFASDITRRRPDIWNSMTWTIMGERKWRVWRKMLANIGDEHAESEFISSTIRPAIRNRLRKFIFVGLYEYLEDSAKTLFRLLKRAAPESMHADKTLEGLANSGSPGKRGGEDASITAELKKLLDPLVKLDELVYSEAKTQFADRISLGVGRANPRVEHSTVDQADGGY